MQTLRSHTGLSGPALLLACLTGCGADAEPMRDALPPPVVRLAPPRPSAEAPVVTAVGRIEAADEARLGFMTGGVVRRVAVDIGDRVRTGQVLAELDATVLDAGLAQAREQAAQAQRDLTRIEGLVGRQLVPRQQLDDARTKVGIADAAVRAAGFQRRHGQIVAAANGVVLARLAEPGEVVAAGQAIVALSSAEQGWRLRIEVADRDAVRLEAGDAATVRLDAFPGNDLKARIREIGGQAARGSGALTVDLDVDAAGLPLRSGLIGRASLPLRSSGGLAIPVSALLAADGVAARVLVAESGIARSRGITVGALRDGMIEVLTGLTAADQVIVEGAAWAEEGRPVRVIARD